MILCALAFLLFFVSDLPDLFGKCKSLKYTFYAGSVLLVWTTADAVLKSESACSPVVRIIAGSLSVCFLALTAASLFASFNIAEGYGKSGGKRHVYTKKLYALSRHPGVLFLILFYFLMIPAFGVPLPLAGLASVLDIALAVFEDCLVFPKVLTGYAEYRKTTPFLVPSVKSLRNCLHDFGRKMK